MRLIILQRGTFNLGEWELHQEANMIVAPGVITRATDQRSLEDRLSKGPNFSIAHSDGFLHMRPDFKIDDVEGMSLIGYSWKRRGIKNSYFVPRRADVSFPLVFSEMGQQEQLRLTARRLPEPVTFYTLKKDVGITIVDARQVRPVAVAREYCLALHLIPNVIGHAVGPEGRKKYCGDFIFDDSNPPMFIFPTGIEREWTMIYPISLWGDEIRQLTEGGFYEEDMLLKEKARALSGELIGPRGKVLKEVLEDCFGLKEGQIHTVPLFHRDGAELLRRSLSPVPSEAKG